MQQIRNLMKACLWPDELPEDYELRTTYVDGIINKFGFVTEQTLAHKEEIRALLDTLSEDFRASGGQGQSFLYLGVEDGYPTFGDHLYMEALCVLAIAAGLGKWTFPRELWSALPGSVPYFTYLDK